MKNDIKSFAKGGNASPPQGNAAPDAALPNIDPAMIDPAFQGDVQCVLEKYVGKSDDELMSELLRHKQSGVIDAGSLQGVAQKISPMLNGEQQSRLHEILKRLM